MKTDRRARRAAYAVIVAIVGLALITMFAFVLARYAMLDMAGEKRAALESCANQVFESARAWSVLHCTELRDTPPVMLPIDELLPAATSGEAQLRRLQTAAGHSVVECRLRLAQGRQRLQRRAQWPLPAVSTTRPASDAATP